MRRGQPDRVPVLPQIWLDHASLATGYDLLELLREPSALYDVLLALWRRYRMDGIRVFMVAKPRHIVERDGHYVEIDPRTGAVLGRVDIEGGGTTIPIDSEPLVKSKADLGKIPVLQPDDYADNIVKPVSRFVSEVGDDLFIAGAVGHQSINALVVNRGATQAMVDLVENPSLAMAIMERATEASINKALAFVRAGVDCLYMGDASASASLISPNHFRQYCLPLYREFVRVLRPYGVLIYLHICGNSVPILELMADTGVDCIEPLDPLGGVDVADAKRRVGHRVALMGGVNTLTLLRGSPEEVEAEARECIRKGATGGGYILGAGDMVPRHARPENVDAMIAAAKKYGTYPLEAEVEAGPLPGQRQ
jgi:MtaA/CmuA family methyltransferase